MRAKLAMAWLIVLTWIVAVFAVGCTSVQPQTFDQRLAVTLSQVTSVRLIAADLVYRDRMSADDGAQVLALTDNARMVIDQARVVQHVNEADAIVRLRLAQDILTQLEQYLRERQE